ncbi:MAG: phage tail sheath family protein [Anaerolineales bacterium]|nr:phage tail sheath family protein [Anaerolineales bacterium]MCB9128394.1 phage tail sheath family protein [Ardenticatenales bacterium]
MPLNYKAPGVYVEEVSTGARPIESAGTSVLAMVGLVAEEIEAQQVGGGTIRKATPTTPTLVTNWTEFTNNFGGLDQSMPGGYLHQAMYGYFLNGGSAAWIVGIPVPVTTSNNGGANDAVPPESAMPRLTTGEGYLPGATGDNSVRLSTRDPMKAGESYEIEVVESEDKSDGSFSLKITSAGGDAHLIPNLSLSRAKNQRTITDVLPQETHNVLQAEILEGSGTLAERAPAVGTKITLMAQPASEGAVTADSASGPRATLTPARFRGDASARTGIAGLEAVEDVTLVACPDVVAAHQAGVFSDDDVKAVQSQLLNHCEMMQDRFAILDGPPGMTVQEMVEWRQEKMNFDSAYGALYYPWIQTDEGMVPPSGHLAGLYARVDGQRGVHKAPANEIVRGAIGLERNVSRNEQELLNPIAVNCIRSFPGQGIRVWGARTLSSDARWRYINVRRLFSNVEESLLQGTNWIVFEPNDELLWSAVRRDVGAYLTTVWRSGALFGRTPEQAFFVRCDAETNPPEVRDLGYCIIEVGIAPVKPAEFVVFRISQKEEGASSSAA